MSATQEYVGKRVTFRELFDHHPRIEIPIIQRDYAQGRNSASALEIRSLFLDALHSTLSKPPAEVTDPLDLDFVYGSREGQTDPAFCPLDGQQRLTTLFLLHWYLAWSDGKTEDFAGFLKANGKSRFAYSVRSSSGEFLDEMVRWFPASPPTDVSSLRCLIENQPWFFQWWKRDPTIESALTMLDAIHGKFRGTQGFYDRIVRSEGPYITFQLLDLDNFGLSDDLYIKMNARGKALTAFETFKALVEKHIGENFPEPDARKLFGLPASLKHYFSHQIDTTWADLLWVYRDPQTNLFDGQVMNLIRAAAIITRDPDTDDTDSIVEILKNPPGRLSFQKYLELKCLDRKHVELLITLLDACSGSADRMRVYLPETTYFDEDRSFRRILAGTSTYADLIQFCAYAEFFRQHGTAPDPDRFGEWMRVVRNLTINSDIERPVQFRRSLRSVIDLLKHSGRILGFLAESGSKVDGFNAQQIREERIKAALILKGGRWKDAVLKAEQHGYFNGQIEFLLDFSGVLQFWNSNSSCEWNAADDHPYFEKFSAYSAKAGMLFGATGLIPHGEFRTERALLAMGDYTVEKGLNRSFLENADEPVTWKRLLRGEQVQQAGHRRGYLKQLLDRIDVNAGAPKSLDDVIATASVPDLWRRLLVRNPKMMECCGKRQFRFRSASTVYLLKSIRMSSDHAELFTYDMCLGMLAEKGGRGELIPFHSPTYTTVHTDSSEPYIILSCKGVAGMLIQIWNSDGTFWIRLYPAAADLPAAMREALETEAGCEAGGDGLLSVRIGYGEVESSIDRIVSAVRQHLPG